MLVLIGNCRSKEGHCPFSKNPMYHSGFTGKSGPETWFWCDYKSKPIRHIHSCELAGNYVVQQNKKKWINEMKGMTND